MTVKRSGYLTTAAALAWASGREINSLADNEYTDLSDEIDNGTNLYMFADLYVALASATWDTVDCGLEVYLVPSVNGTNYPTWTGDGTTDLAGQNAYFVGFIPVTDTGAGYAFDGVLSNIALPNGKYKWAFRSRLGVTTASSGNTIYWRPHSVQEVA